MVEIPQDFFVDIVSQNNFLVRALTNLFENIKVFFNGFALDSQNLFIFVYHSLNCEEEFFHGTISLWVYHSLLPLLK